MRLVSWYVSGYRNLKEVSLDCKDGVLIAGNNNTGKSNILQSIVDYRSLFGEPETQLPPREWWTETYEDGETSSENDETSEITSEGRSADNWSEWIDDRTREENQRITFSATFEPEGDINGEDLDVLSDSYLGMLKDLQQSLGGSDEWLHQHACSPDSFSKFIHTLTIDSDGIHAEYFETNHSSTRIVLSARTESGEIRDLIYDKIGHGSQTERFESVSDLQRDDLSPSLISELTEQSPGDTDEEPVWFREFRGDSPRRNNHGAVIPETIHDQIAPDIENWRHIPAVRNPGRQPNIDELEEISDIDLNSDFSNVFEYCFSIKFSSGEDLTEESQRYARIVEDVVSLDLNMEGTAIQATQREEGTEQVFDSQDMSTGSIQVLCLLSALHAHRYPGNRQTPSGSVILIEEPETHLNPHTQRRILEYILEDSEVSFSPIITTHSPTFVDQDIGDLEVTIQDGQETTTWTVKDDVRSELRILYDLTLSDLLQANAVFLIPSNRWRIIISAVLSEFDVDLVEQGIVSVVCTSKDGFEMIGQTVSHLDVPVLTADHIDIDDSQYDFDFAIVELPERSVARYFNEHSEELEQGFDGESRDLLQESPIDDVDAWLEALLEAFKTEHHLSQEAALYELLDLIEVREDWQEFADQLQGYQA